MNEIELRRKYSGFLPKKAMHELVAPGAPTASDIAAARALLAKVDAAKAPEKAAK